MKGILLLFSLIVCTHTIIFSQTQPNIIFIMVDDLNDYVEGFQGHSQVETPNIAELASVGYAFTNAYCSSPGCAPSRTSLLSGKDLVYTQLYNNEEYPDNFREVFEPEFGNETVYSLPEILKDSGGYFTYSINKIFHREGEGDFQFGGPVCNKGLSWNKNLVIEDEAITLFLKTNYSDYSQYSWAKVPDIYETQLSDYVGTDSAISFINQVSEGTANICDNKPFFLAIGYHQPHAGRIVPEKYFHDFYMDDNYEYPLDLPYNEPYNAYPPNGVIMPPQPPEGKWADFEAFPEASISKSFADNTETEENFSDYISSLSSLPLVAPGLSSEEVVDVLMESERANFVTNYLASIKYIDAQIGRLMDELNAHPALVENTIIIFLSDHGYSLGEKKHYTKWALWETDIRTPMIIVDPSRTGNKVSSRTVSLLDIFPTVLDLAGVNHPKFDDGSEYLDGTSLIPLLINVSKQWEKPALVSTLKNCSMPLCDPDYSVRNERFHYIRYHHDDTASFIYDSLGNDILEQELYEIGTKRETDPNEWTNLAYDPDYAPVIAYLDNFFPDSSMYLQKAQKVEISNGPISCLLTNTGKLKLKLKLYNADGVLVSGPTLSGYSYKWTNNITAGTSFGINYNFPLNTIPIATYTTTDKIIFYIHVYEITTGKLVAFDTKTFYLNPVNAPSIFYNAYVSGMQVSIEDYSLTGSFKSSSWDFGDGGIMEEFLPAAHTYSTPGTYTIKNTVFYGNGCSTISSKTVTILEDVKTTEEVLGVSDFNMRVFPNPANQTITLVYDPQYTGISIAILNSFGQVMLNKTTDLSGAIDISGLPAGNYIIKLTHSGGYETSIFEVMR